jgi:hypothetical protein
MHGTEITALDDAQPTEVGEAQAAWLRAVMRRHIRLEVAAQEPHDPRLVDVDARDLAMGC